MEDQVGMLVGRIFFGICAAVSLFGAIKPEIVLRDSLKFIKKYQFEDINDEPSLFWIKISRIINISFVALFILAIFLWPKMIE